MPVIRVTDLSFSFVLEHIANVARLTTRDKDLEWKIFSDNSDNSNVCFLEIIIIEMKLIGR